MPIRSTSGSPSCSAPSPHPWPEVPLTGPPETASEQGSHRRVTGHLTEGRTVGAPVEGHLIGGPLHAHVETLDGGYPLLRFGHPNGYWLVYKATSVNTEERTVVYTYAGFEHTEAPSP